MEEYMPIKKYIEENYVPKARIKEKIEELRREVHMANHECIKYGLGSGSETDKKMQLDAYAMHKLEELLGGEE